MQALYTQKRDYFLQGLDGLGLSHNDPQGSYFVLVDISELLKQPRFEGMDDLAFCEWMIKEIGVAAVPGSSFFKEGGSQYIRLHFARSEKTLGEALKRLGKLVV
jgi:aminotransferase